MSVEPVETESGPEARVTTRRGVLAGAGVVGATALLAACGTEAETGDAGEGGATPPADSGADTDEDADTGDDTDDEDDGEDPDQDSLASVDEVPVGGGFINADADVVITQPSEGEWHGFSATCTHEGCTVASVSDGTINCACHGSRFSIQDGSAVNGPASRPLESKAIAVDGDRVIWA